MQGVAVLPAGQEVPPSLHAGCRGRRCSQGLPLAAGLHQGGARPPCPADPQPQQCDHGGCLGPTRELLEQSRAVSDMHRPKLCPKLPRTPRTLAGCPCSPGRARSCCPQSPPARGADLGLGKDLLGHAWPCCGAGDLVSRVGPMPLCQGCGCAVAHGGCVCRGCAVLSLRGVPSPSVEGASGHLQSTTGAAQGASDTPQGQFGPISSELVV